MKRKNLFAFLLSAALFTTTCLPVTAAEIQTENNTATQGVSASNTEKALFEQPVAVTPSEEELFSFSEDTFYMSEAENTGEVSTNDTNESEMKSEEIEVFEVSETEETPPTAAVGDTFTVDEISYTITGTEPSTVEATNCTPFLSGALNIPQTVTFNDITYMVTTIGGEFRGRTSLTSITIPEGVTTVGDQAFLGCSNVTVINLPSTLQVFTRAGFAGLETINLAEGNEVYSVVDGVLFKDNGTKLWLYPSAKAGSSYDIPNTVTTIVNGSFYYNQNLTTLTIPETVTTIELCAFYHCQGLQDITIGAGVTSFGEYNLYCCDNLETVTLKGSYVLGHHSINNCPKLTTITIDGQMRGAAAYALYNLPALEQYIVLNSDYFTARDGVLFNGTRLFSYPSAKTDTTYVVPDGTTEIMALAFNFMQNTYEVILPPGVYLNGGSFAFPNETTPMQIYFRDTESVSMSKSVVFSNLAAGSKIYGANQTVVDSINSYTNAINPVESATVEVGFIPADGISFDNVERELIVGDTLKLMPTVTPESATEKIIWTSSDDTVATVKNGVVTAVGAGDAVITGAIGNGSSASCKLHVNSPNIPITGIYLDMEVIDLYLGQSVQLTADIEPEDTTDSKILTWISSDPSVATVQDGKVTAVSEGDAKITVRTSNGQEAFCKVYVASSEEKLLFTDVNKSDWFYDSVAYVNANGLMTGLNETTFGPNQPLARAQFAVILHRMNNTPEVTYTDKFPDVPDGIWFTNAILWANSTGVVTGYLDTGKFGPSDNINREQMAVMMYRYAKYMNYNISQKVDFSKFADATRVSSFAEEAMKWAVGNGIITGKNNGTILDPQGNATRAECATIIMRFKDYFEKI